MTRLVFEALLSAILAWGALPAEREEAFRREREAMVRLVKYYDPKSRISNPKVLEAMLKVPRHLFVPHSITDQAYVDSPLPIGEGQTISQPFIVGYMTQVLSPKPGDSVLEIGTGSGYQAAILAGLVSKVYTIEIIEPLARRAKETLRVLGYSNVQVKIGDGYRGWPEHAPFDAVIVTCAPDHIPQALIDQLKVGGRMVIPVGPEVDASPWVPQELYVVRKTRAGIFKEKTFDVRFVSMQGEAWRKKP
jgi:protein-L-isoaspartate(D-aspartate) O-methyltransferase